MSKNFSYIKIPYDFIQSDNRMKPEELYLYILLLSKLMRIDNTVETNIELLNQQIQFSSTKTRNTRNKSIIKNLIISMVNKKFIECDNFVEAINNDTLLKIMFPHTDIEKNFVIIHFTEYCKFNNYNEFYIYTYIKKWDKLGCKMSHEELAALIGVKSTRTVKDILYDLNDREIIDIKTGTYYVNDKQETNEYNITKSDESIKRNKKNKESGNWYNNNSLVPEDFVYLWQHTDDEKLQKTAQNKISRISKSEQGKWVINNLEKQANEIMQYEENKIYSDWKTKIKELMEKHKVPIVKTKYQEFYPVTDVGKLSVDDIKGIYYVIGEWGLVPGSDEYGFMHKNYNLIPLHEDKIKKHGETIKEFLNNKQLVSDSDIKELGEKISDVIIDKSEIEKYGEEIIVTPRGKQYDTTDYSRLLDDDYDWGDQDVDDFTI